MNATTAGQPDHSRLEISGHQVARRLWELVETINAPIYFAPEARTAAADAGMKGFWMGYFGFRAAPLGPVAPSVATGLFFGFAPRVAERALPTAWEIAAPADLVAVRWTAASAFLGRLTDGIEESRLARINEVLWGFVAGADLSGRALGAANAALSRPDDPLAALWQACTTLREHRGDGHVAAYVAEGITGLEAHILHAAAHGTPDEVFAEQPGVDHGGVDGGEVRSRRPRLADRIAHAHPSGPSTPRSRGTTHRRALMAVDRSDDRRPARAPGTP